MRKKVWIVLLVLFMLLTAGVIVAYNNSYNIALKGSGFSKDSINYIETGTDDNGAEYRVVFQYMPDNTVKIALLTKTNWGTWRVTDSVQGPNAETDYITMGWMRVAGIRQYDVNGNAEIDFEVHNVYGGNNAKAQIEIPQELLPPNVFVSVFQSGSVYVLHFVSYGEADVLNDIHGIDLLRQAGSIE